MKKLFYNFNSQVQSDIKRYCLIVRVVQVTDSIKYYTWDCSL